MGFMYSNISIQICEISHQTFGPCHRQCPTCPNGFHEYSYPRPVQSLRWTLSEQSLRRQTLSNESCVSN